MTFWPADNAHWQAFKLESLTYVTMTVTRYYDIIIHDNFQVGYAN